MYKHFLILEITIFSFLLFNLSSCSADDCQGYEESPCFSPDDKGSFTVFGDVVEKVNDSTFIPVNNCTVSDSGWYFNDTQCGSTQCPLYSMTKTDSSGHFELDERPNANDHTLYISKEGFKDASFIINRDTTFFKIEVELERN